MRNDFFEKRRLLSWLFPARCPVCGEILKGNSFVCPGCRKELHLLEGPVCAGCGRPVDQEQKEYCRDCRRKHRELDQNLAPLVYQGWVKEALLELKYQGQAGYASFFAALMYLQIKENLTLWKPQVILPVPIHPKRLRMRGYNQAEELARELSGLTGIPLVTGELLRRKNTVALKKLTGNQRKESLKNAFSLAGKHQLPGRVLVVDDIYTTGATMNAIAALLKNAGVEKVFGVCASIGSLE